MNIGIAHDNYSPPDRSWKGVGERIGESNSLRHLTVDSLSLFGQQDITDFCDGAAKNKSLLSLALVCGFRELAALKPLFENGGLMNLSVCDFECVEDNVQQLFHETVVSSLSSFESLRKLELKWLGIGDKIFQELIPVLQCHKLETLDIITGNYIYHRGMLALASWLRDPNCTLKILILTHVELQDYDLATLAGGLKENSTVEKLNLNCVNHQEGNITQGLQELWSVWDNSQSRLEDISLYNNHIGDDALNDLVNAPAGKQKLRHLNIMGSENITRIGWMALATHLQSPECSMTELKINHVDDDGAIIIANSLAKCTSLKKLFVGSPSDSNITRTGFHAFTQALCDKSSVINTFESNHSLEFLDISPSASDLSFYLDLNKNNNRADAARKKIIKTHLSGEMVVKSFLGLKIEVLPYAILWIGKEGVDAVARLTLLYKFSRDMPQVFSFFNSLSFLRTDSRKRRRI